MDEDTKDDVNSNPVSIFSQSSIVSSELYDVLLQKKNAKVHNTQHDAVYRKCECGARNCKGILFS